MNNQKRKSSKEKEEQLQAEIRKNEIEEIFAASASTVGEQTVINNLGQISSENELKQFILGNIPDDPEEKYNVYYKGVEKLLRKFLPKGKEHSDARKIIREEKKIFLTRGKKLNSKGIRGADSRMAYIPDMEEIMNMITKWAFENGNTFDLYKLLRDKNLELGYHKN